MKIFYTQKKKKPTIEISHKSKTVQTDKVLLDLSEHEFLDFASRLSEFVKEYSSDSLKITNNIFRFDTQTNGENVKTIIFAIGD